MKKTVLFILKSYKKAVSPTLEAIFGHACRFTPTCSEYSYQAIEKYGIKKGSVLALKRISRCHPFTEPGYDPLVKSA